MVIHHSHSFTMNIVTFLISSQARARRPFESMANLARFAKKKSTVYFALFPDIPFDYARATKKD